MNIEFLATVAVIAPDPINSRKLYVEALGLPLQGEGDGYHHSEQIAGCKSFGIWPLSQAAQACFGTDQWPAERPVPQVSIEFDVANAATVVPAAGSSSRPAMSCCMELARSHGARRSPGCNHPRAPSSASPTRPCCTADSSPRIQQSHLPAVAEPRITAGAALTNPLRVPAGDS
jgi:hypothetical protein